MSRVALVTGASRGIGLHIAQALADAGWSVVGLSRSGGSTESGIPLLACDVTDADAVQDTLTTVVAQHGRIDLLVNSAGLIEQERPLWEADPDDWWQTMVTNVRGPFLMCHAVVPLMIGGGGGRVINLNSGAGTRERADLTAYCASKSALARITGGVALAGAEHGVLALDLAPGVVETDMTHGMKMHEGRTDWTDPKDVTDLVLAFAEGELDAFSGRMVRAGADSLEQLRRTAATGLDDDARKLRLRPWGEDDPLAT